MNPHLRTALRFAAYIRAIGGDPIPFRHGTHYEWSLDLQRQHERLRQAVTPELAKAAKTSARALIRQRGYRRAAEEAAPVPLTTCNPEKPGDRPVNAGEETGKPIEQSAPVVSRRESRDIKSEEIVCRKKLFHSDYWSAISHVRRLGNDVRVYPCFCGGLHVGHSPDAPRTKQYRCARKRLRVIEKRLMSLEGERTALVQERRALQHELGNDGQAEEILFGIAEHARRMLIALTVRIGSG